MFSPARRSVPGRLPQMSDSATAPSLAIVLPAYNEADRIGPALDELFGYLRPARRRGRARRDRGRPRCPSTSRSSSSMTGAPTGPRRSSLRGPRRPPAARWCEPARPHASRTAGRAPRSGPGCSLADDRPDRLRRCRHGDAARPAAAARRGAGRPRRCPRLADPAGRLGHAREPARLSAAASARRSTCSRRCGRSGPVEDTQCGFKGFTRQAAHDLFEMTAGHQHRLRRRGDLPRAPPRLPDRGRADPLGGPARVADARRPAARDARRVGPVPDPADPSARSGGTPSSPPDGHGPAGQARSSGPADRGDRASSR